MIYGSAHAKLIKSDIAIIGGGVAGSAAAAMLGKSGHDCILIDPHEVYPDDFRCEKLNRPQMQTLENMGLANAVFKSCTPIESVWISRLGHLLNKVNYPHYGFSYQTLITAIRDDIPKTVKKVFSKVKTIENTATKQTLTLVDGTQVTCRIVIMANGLNPGLRRQLGVEQEMLSRHHVMAVGFDLKPENNNNFGFESLTYWPEKVSSKMAYFTAFKNDGKFRANLFGYWKRDEETILNLQTAPEEALTCLMPSLEKTIGKFSVDGRVHVRPIDLYQTHSHTCDGVVFIGDAYSTSCPGAGTGVGKALIDVKQLCGTHIPDWLESNELSAKTIGDFYKDPEKLESDTDSINGAYFLHGISTKLGPGWSGRRWIRFIYHFARGTFLGIPFRNSSI